MINSRMFAFLLLFLFLSFTVLIQAETRIFSYIDDNGKVVYTNTPSISIKEVETTEMKIERYQNVIDNISSRFKVDPKLIHAIIVAESNYNPYAVSRKGAKGMMQLMPGTAKRYGVKRVFDPIDNIIGGVKYFKDLLIIFDGDLRYALAAYNAGENMVKSYNGIPPFKETRDYVQKVLALYESSGGRKTAYKYWDFQDKIHYSFDKPTEGTYKKISIINLTD
ncbi:MAG: hypothetical protein A2Y62_04085 [Candidatus Fischerbacteria bacterium RBG_13_37_8]|uniref:Transglycosylase SLT domain-containing protein n=1 Tax=Candidatus Fischerbacteria bacterium RBG_13_37_8 TaxID=1817863 RepID=A0A1F5V4T7_9BACT|nr:MAG: hypothetical protein A2Y62_04085 [Candidatus Fischerbacteria bacterium RBG_13_37_8]